MNTIDSQDYDAELVLLAEGPIEKNEMRLYKDGEDLGPPYKVFNHLLKQQQADRMGESEEITKYIFGDFDKKLEQLKEELGKEVVDIILNGRLRMSLLISSDGGLLKSADNLSQYMKIIKENGGINEAYLNVALGGATEMFLHADKRIIHPFSAIFVDPLNGGTEEFKEHRYFMLKLALALSTLDDKRDELDEFIAGKEKDNLSGADYDTALSFSSNDMVYYGISHELTQSLAEMREKFAKRTGLDFMSQDICTDFEMRVKRFFEES